MPKINYYKKYNIPKQIQIAGKVIDVVFDEKLTFNESAAGMADYSNERLVIRPDTPDYPVSMQSIQSTFWHEVLHWCFHIAGEFEARNDEKLINVTSEFLYQVFKQLCPDEKTK